MNREDDIINITSLLLTVQSTTQQRKVLLYQKGILMSLRSEKKSIRYLTIRHSLYWIPQLEIKEQ